MDLKTSILEVPFVIEAPADTRRLSKIAHSILKLSTTLKFSVKSLYFHNKLYNGFTIFTVPPPSPGNFFWSKRLV